MFIKKEGFRFFWKGNGVNCIRIFPQIAINYSIFRQSKNIFKNTFENKNTVILFLVVSQDA